MSGDVAFCWPGLGPARSVDESVDEMPVDLTAEREAARAEAFELGLTEGRAAAGEEISAAVERQLAEPRERLHESLSKLDALFADEEASATEHLARLVQSACLSVIGQELRTNEVWWRARLAEIRKALMDDAPTIHYHPDDAEWVNPERFANLTLLEDPTLSPGSIRAESATQSMTVDPAGDLVRLFGEQWVSQ